MKHLFLFKVLFPILITLALAGCAVEKTSGDPQTDETRDGGMATTESETDAKGDGKPDGL
ncbi:MAG: hypothetical protein WDZ54_02905 [Sneathiella sp.]